MKVWIVKYALTMGIYPCEGTLVGRAGRTPTYFCGTDILGEPQVFTKMEWCETKEAAMEMAEAMKQDKIKFYREQIERLERLDNLEID